MEIKTGDILRMKKPHPCSSVYLTVLRTGSDIKVRCRGCGREMLIPRVKLEKSIKKVVPPEEL